MKVFRERTILGFKSWKVITGAVTIIVLVMLMVLISRGNTKSISKDTGRHRSVDPATMNLSQAAIKKLKENHINPTYSRGATIFTDNSGRIIVPPDNVLDRMTFRDLEETYHRYLETVQTRCIRQIHLGSIHDGGYDLCDDTAVAPSTPCTVYSFGVREDFSFDEDISQMYGCTVHSFDPNNGMTDHKHTDKVTFHATGLGDQDGVFNDWRMRTLDTIKRELGHKTVDILKIDIEAGEWTSLPEIISSGSFHGVKQLILELHSWVDLDPWTVDHRTRKDYTQHLKVLRSLFEEGFRIFFFKRFPADCCVYTDEFGIHRTGCHEIHMMQVKNNTVTSSTRKI